MEYTRKDVERLVVKTLDESGKTCDRAEFLEMVLDVEAVLFSQGHAILTHNDDPVRAW